jgi:DNA-binding MarR family transcriptional regulator
MGFLLAKAAQRWNELLVEQFARAGYPEVRASYGSVLVPLFEEDGLRMSELAARARLTKQTMTTMVRLVERDGLARRVPDPRDGRATRVYLSERGRSFHEVAEQALRRLDRNLRARLSSSDVDRLLTMLKGVMNL